MITLDPDKCTNCSICSHVCPHGVIVINDITAELAYTENCVACGACQLNCPSGAVRVTQKSGCVITIIKEDILKIKGGKPCKTSVCSEDKSLKN